MREGDQDTYTAIIGGLTAVDSGAEAAGSLRLTAAAPNPFRETTRVAFAGAAGDRLRAAVYDVSGRHVRDLDPPVAGGAGALVWDGRDANGRPAQSGFYFLHAEDGSASASARVLLLR